MKVHVETKVGSQWEWTWNFSKQCMALKGNLPRKTTSPGAVSIIEITELHGPWHYPLARLMEVTLM